MSEEKPLNVPEYLLIRSAEARAKHLGISVEQALAEIKGESQPVEEPVVEEPVWVVGAVERYTNKYERDTAIEDSCIGLIHFENDLQFFIQSDLMDNDSPQIYSNFTKGL